MAAGRELLSCEVWHVAWDAVTPHFHRNHLQIASLEKSNLFSEMYFKKNMEQHQYINKNVVKITKLAKVLKIDSFIFYFIYSRAPPPPPVNV